MKKKASTKNGKRQMSSGSDFTDENSPQAKIPQLEREDTIVQDNINFIPPEDLIAKSLFIQEPIKTGAPINFM